MLEVNQLQHPYSPPPFFPSSSFPSPFFSPSPFFFSFSLFACPVAGKSHRDKREGSASQESPRFLFFPFPLFFSRAPTFPRVFLFFSFRPQRQSPKELPRRKNSSSISGPSPLSPPPPSLSWRVYLISSFFFFSPLGHLGVGNVKGEPSSFSFFFSLPRSFLLAFFPPLARRLEQLPVFFLPLPFCPIFSFFSASS